jgi:hypothetical protein
VTRRTFALAVAVLALLTAALPARSHAAAEMLPDTTTLEGWRLANGLEVRVRNVSGATGISIATAYRAGTLYDTPGHEGMADLLTELQFMCAAGDVPERNREEMDSLRPLGWTMRTTPHVAVFMEVASLQQFPGVLRQVAARMRGVTVTEATLGAAVIEVKRDLGSRFLGRPELTLYHYPRALALGLSDEAILARGSGRAFAGLTPKDATALLHEAFVPANACLALVGDLSKVDVHALVEREFGGIPAGTARADASDKPLAGARRSVTRVGLGGSLGVVGVIAPALDDSLHPSFYLASLFAGAFMSEVAGKPTPPLRARFQYSILDEPDLARLYPDVDPQETNAVAVAMSFNQSLELLSSQMIGKDLMNTVRTGVDWILGGPLPPGLLGQARIQPGSLAPLAGGMATRAIWRGDDFWDRYRLAFETTPLAPSIFFAWMASTEHQSVLLLTPRK